MRCRMRLGSARSAGSALDRASRRTLARRYATRIGQGPVHFARLALIAGPTQQQEVLRARRMLIERNAPPDGGGGVAAIAPPLKQGMDMFLAELSQRRGHNAGSSSYQTPLDVCAFCTQVCLCYTYHSTRGMHGSRSSAPPQFLPSTYRDPEADRKEEEERRTASAQLRANRLSHARPSHHSSLIIQHRPSVPSSPSSRSHKRGPNRPDSESDSPSQPSSQPPPSFRLLSSDAARVFRIDTPSLVTSTATNVLDRSPPGERQLLGAGSVLHDLGAQSRLESTSILRGQQLAGHSRHHFPHLRDAQHPAPSKAQEETRQARNIVLDARNGAETLYTGASVVRSLLLGRPPSAADAAAVASTMLAQQQHQQANSLSLSSKERARVVPTKHGRHWKIELRFPSTARRLGAP